MSMFRVLAVVSTVPCTSSRWMPMVVLPSTLPTRLELLTELVTVTLNAPEISSSLPARQTLRAGPQQAEIPTPDPETVAHAALRWTSGRLTRSRLLSLLTLALPTVLALATPLADPASLATTATATRMVVISTLTDSEHQTSSDLAKLLTPSPR